MKSGLIMFALSALVSSSAIAAPMCVTNTLAGYISLGSSGCDIGTATFSGFTTLPPITGALGVSAGDVTINPFQSGNTIGIDVSMNTTAIAGQLREALIGYMLAGPLITGSMVSLSGTSVTGGGSVTEIQDYCKGGNFLPGGVSGCDPNHGTLVVLNVGTDQATFAPVSKLSIVHDFTLDAGRGGTASGGTVADRFTIQAATPIPEPQTAILISSALLAAASGTRFRKFAERFVRRKGQK